MKYKQILFDTNLFIVFIIGSIDINLIPKVKRLASYSIDDYNLLSNIIKNSETLVVTNSIVTETCNLLDSLNNNYDYKIFKIICELLKKTKDKTNNMIEILNNPAFSKFGFTDAEVNHLSNEGCIVFTDDSKLYYFMSNQGKKVYNINHIRQLNFFS
jgi:hypothetical protein